MDKDLGDINSIISGLSDKDIESLKNMANQIFGTSENQSSPRPSTDSRQSPEQSSPKEGSELSSLMQEMPNLNLSALSGLIKGFKQDDARLDLIKALKPMLSPARQHRADEAIKMLKMFNMLPILQKSGILGDLMK